MKAFESTQAVGEVADRIDNLISALTLPLGAELHVKSIREILPDIRAQLRAAFVGLTGDNPWKEEG